MATKVFSSRADAKALAFADSLARRRYGISYGQYCGTVLLEYIDDAGALPPIGSAKKEGDAKRRAAALIKDFSARPHNSRIGAMTDAEVRDLMAARYE